MAIQNTFYLDVDIKRDNYVEEPQVTQNDNIAFVLRLTDDGIDKPIEGVSTYTLASLRADGQSVLTVGTLSGPNEVTFELGSTEVSVPGRVKAAIQLYDVDGRVSSIPFTYEVTKDLATNYVPSKDEQTLIELVLGEGPVILAEARQATADAIQATSDLTALKTEVVDATAKANTAANHATTEGDRASTQADRADTAATNAEGVYNAILPVLPNIEGWGYDPIPYDPATTYEKNNIVSHDGSTYISLVDNNVGNTPTLATPNANWGVLARRGIDGMGAVSSVNGVGPDASGDVLVDTYTRVETDSRIGEISSRLEETDKLYINPFYPPPPLLPALGGSSDDTSVFKAIINLLEQGKGGTILLPEVFNISETLVIKKPISIIGVGTTGDNLDERTPMKEAISGLNWSGANSEPMIWYSPEGDFTSPRQIKGIQIKNFCLFGDDIASNGLILDRVQNSLVEHLRIFGFTNTCLSLITTSSFPNNNIQFNTFINIQLEQAPTPLFIGGTTVSNYCHNQMTNIFIDHNGQLEGQNGFILGESDNNVFENFFCYNRGNQNNYSVYIAGAEANIPPSSNYFIHLQGRTIIKGGNEGTVIIGYDKANGQPEPTIEATAKVLMIQSGSNATAHLNNLPIRGLAGKLTGSTNPANNETIDEGFFKLIGNNGQKMAIGLNDNNRNLELWHDASGSGFNQVFGITHYGFDWYKIGGKRVMQGTTYPTSGNWSQGDEIFNTAPTELGPSPNKYIINGWKCVSSGNPGTWVQMRSLTGN